MTNTLNDFLGTDVETSSNCQNMYICYLTLFHVTEPSTLESSLI